MKGEKKGEVKFWQPIEGREREGNKIPQRSSSYQFELVKAVTIGRRLLGDLRGQHTIGRGDKHHRDSKKRNMKAKKQVDGVKGVN